MSLPLLCDKTLLARRAGTFSLKPLHLSIYLKKSKVAPVDKVTSQVTCNKTALNKTTTVMLQRCPGQQNVVFQMSY